MNQETFPLSQEKINQLAIQDASTHFSMINDEDDVTKAAILVTAVMEDPEKYGHQFKPYEVTFDDDKTDFYVEVKRGKSKLYFKGKTKENDKILSRTVLSLCTQAYKNEYNL